MFTRPSKTASAYRATWGDTVLAESDRTVALEGNTYFPPEDVRWAHLAPSTKSTICPWKGEASYFDVKDGDRVLPAAAWTYETPGTAAIRIRRHLAFWNGVKVERIRG